MHTPPDTTPPRLLLAPLRGLTDLHFRSCFARHFPGFTLAVAPFLNPQQQTSKKISVFADLLPENNLDLPVVPQLLDNRVESFLACARQLEELGYQQVNWNLGCPAPMVTGKGRGSAMLAHPEKICQLLEAVLPQLHCQLSIKMRLGLQQRQEAFTLLPLLNQYPLSEIIIHPRLGRQLYRGVPDWEGFAECLHLSRHQLVYNGDITSLAVYQQLRSRFPAINSWMIGRGAVANPFLPAAIRQQAPDVTAARHQLLSSFHDQLYQRYQQRLAGPGHLLGKMKQLWLYLIASFPEQQRMVKKITKAGTTEQYLTAVREIFAAAAETATDHQETASFRRGRI